MEHASYDFFLGLGRTCLLSLFGFGLKDKNFFERALISAEDNVKLCEKYRKQGSIPHDRVFANISRGIGSKIGSKLSNLTSVLSGGIKGQSDGNYSFNSSETYTEVEALAELAYLQSLALLAGVSVLKDMKLIPALVKAAVNGKLAHSCLLRVEQLFHEEHFYPNGSQENFPSAGRIKWESKDGQVNFCTGVLCSLGILNFAASHSPKAICKLMDFAGNLLYDPFFQNFEIFKLFELKIPLLLSFSRFIKFRGF